MDLIGEIQPNSLARHKFQIVTVNYFTKCVEAKLIILATQKDIIDFVEDYHSLFRDFRDVRL